MSYFTFTLYGEQYGDSLKKLGIKITYDPTALLLGIYPEETIIEKAKFYLFCLFWVFVAVQTFL